MKHGRRGRSETRISSIGLGCVTFGREIDERTSFRLLDYAVELGINFLDTAEATPRPIVAAIWTRTTSVRYLAKCILPSLPWGGGSSLAVVAMM